MCALCSAKWTMIFSFPIDYTFGHSRPKNDFAINMDIFGEVKAEKITHHNHWTHSLSVHWCHFHMKRIDSEKNRLHVFVSMMGNSEQIDLS